MERYISAPGAGGLAPCQRAIRVRSGQSRGATPRQRFVPASVAGGHYHKSGLRRPQHNAIVPIYATLLHAYPRRAGPRKYRTDQFDYGYIRSRPSVTYVVPPTRSCSPLSNGTRPARLIGTTSIAWRPASRHLVTAHGKLACGNGRPCSK